MMDTNLLRSDNVHYYHFDFHQECSSNSDPMMEFLKNLVLSSHMQQIGLFVQKNEIVSELSRDGLLETKSLVQDVLGL